MYYLDLSASQDDGLIAKIFGFGMKKVSTEFLSFGSVSDCYFPCWPVSHLHIHKLSFGVCLVIFKIIALGLLQVPFSLPENPLLLLRSISK